VDFAEVVHRLFTKEQPNMNLILILG